MPFGIHRSAKSSEPVNPVQPKAPVKQKTNREEYDEKVNQAIKACKETSVVRAQLNQ